MKKRLVALILAAAMAMSTVAGCGSKTLDGSAVVAEVGGEEITANIANFYARYQQSMYETYYAAYLGEDMWSGEVESGITYETSVKEGIMDALQTMYAIKQHAADYGVELSDADKEAISAAAASFVESNGEEEIAAVSGDQETVEEFLSLLTIQSRMYTEMIKDADTEVSDEEAAQKSLDYVYFSYSVANEDGESEDMTDEEKEALKAEAQTFADDAAGAADFAAYATEKGYEASTLTFDSETTSPSAELIEAADQLGEGECTGLVESEYGCYVAVVTSLLDRDATDAEKESIISERQQTLYSDRCTEWVEAADVTVHDSVWNQIDFEKVGVTIKDTTTEETETEETAE